MSYFEGGNARFSSLVAPSPGGLNGFPEVRPSWKLILEGPNSGRYNMALDETLLNLVSDPASPGLTILRFYQWENPTLSLGFSQKAAKVVNVDYCRQNNIDLVRRITGGKAVLHHREITYSITSNDPQFFPLRDIPQTYKAVAQALTLGFKSMGLDTCLARGQKADKVSPKAKACPACFAVSNGYEILCQGRKLVGSAQRRVRSAFLQHGSILLEFDSTFLARATGYRYLANLDLGVTSLAACLGQLPPVPLLISHLQKGFQDFFSVELEPGFIDGSLRQSVEYLARSKYAPLDWDHLTGSEAESGIKFGRGRPMGILSAARVTQKGLTLQNRVL